jgi:hypothetical protein
MINQQTTFPSDSVISVQSPNTSAVYQFNIERQTRTSFNENGAFQYEYFQVNVHDSEGKWLNFGLVDDITDTQEVNGKVLDVISRIENPGPDIGSRFD